MLSTEPKRGEWQISSEQGHFVDPLLDALILMGQYYGKPSSRDSLIAGLPLVENRLTISLFSRAAERAGLSVRLATHALQKVPELLLPCVLLLKEQRCCILLELDQQHSKARILQPEAGVSEVWMPLEELESLFTGHLFYVKQKYQFDERTPEVLDTDSEHWFWSTVKTAWPIYTDVFIASILINLFAVVTPLFVMNVYDRVIPNLAFDSLWVLAVGTFLVFGFDFLLRQLRAYFIDLAGKKLDLQLSAKIFSRVLGIRMEARPASVGAFANNLQSFESVREFITSATIGSLIDLPFALLLLLVIWIVAGPLVLAPAAAMLLLMIYSFFVQFPLKKEIEKSAQFSAQKNATLVEALSGMEAVKITGSQSTFQSLWEQVVSQIGENGIRIRQLTNSVANLSSYLQQMVVVCTVILGVYAVSEGNISMGGIIAAVMLGSRVVAPMAQLSLLATRYNHAKASMRLIDQVMSMPEEQEAHKNYISRPHLVGKIEFDHVDFNYPQQQGHALSQVSLSINPGEKVAIIGRIGAGKSTISKLMLGLYQPSQGEMRIDGVSLGQIHPADLRRNIGCVTQETLLFYGSIRENITLGAPFATDEAVLRAAAFGGVTTFTDEDPDGLDRQVGEGGRFLSGGQRQAVALARSCLLDPPILVFDEPTSQLDNRAEQDLINRLKALGKERTLLLNTHKTSMLEAVDRIIVLERGRVMADGPKEQVLEQLRGGQVRSGAAQSGGARR